MECQFSRFSVDQIILFIQKIKINRLISEIHIHHTWEPSLDDWLKKPDGNYWQNVMYSYHTINNGWSDIGQHFTLDPDGYFWDGRDVNSQPASIKGRNLNALAIEMLGNFDEQHLEGKQRESIVKFCKFAKEYFNADITFHNEYSDKTCPGTNIYKPYFMEWIDNAILIEKFNKIKEIVEG